MNKKGFTLVELLVTIGIVAILTVMAITTVTTVANKIYKKLYSTKIETLVTAAELFVQNNQLLYGIGECNGLPLNTNEACIKVSELIENNYAEIDTSNNNGKCNSSIGCITNPVDSTSMNDDWILVTKNTNTIGIWRGEATGKVVMPLISIENEMDCLKNKNISINFGNLYNAFIYKYYINDVEHDVKKVVTTFSVDENSKVTARIFEGETLLYEAQKNVTNIGNNLRTINYFANAASTITTPKATCCDAGSGCSVTLPTFTAKTGFDKLGWDLSFATFNPKNKEGDKITLTSDATYYAISAKTLTASFYKNTAYSIGSSSVSCDTSSTSCNITTPSITPKTNYTVKGWNTNSNATIAQVAQNTNISINSNTNYYAITTAKAILTCRIDRNIVDYSYTCSEGGTRSGTTCYNYGYLIRGDDIVIRERNEKKVYCKGCSTSTCKTKLKNTYSSRVNCYNQSTGEKDGTYAYCCGSVRYASNYCYGKAVSSCKTVYSCSRGSGSDCAYTYDATKTPVYGCRSGTESSGYCYLYNQVSCPSGWSQLP